MLEIIHFNESKHSLENSLKKASFILKHKPSAIIFENPKDSFNPNNLSQWKKTTKKHIKKYPWVGADIKTIEAIEILNVKKKILLFNMDAPRELTSLHESIVKLQDRFYFDLWNLLREKYMLDCIKKAKQKTKGKIIIFCHNSHWKNLKLLLTNKKINIKKLYFRNSFDKNNHKINSNNKIARILKKYYSLLKIKL